MKYLKFFPFYLLSLFPLSFLYLISDGIFFIVFYLVKYRRDVVKSNLKNSFPDKTMDELNRIEKKFYKHFCDLGFETVKALTINKKSIDERFHIKNKKLIYELFDQKKNIIMYTSHYANWEWLGFIHLYTPYPVQTFYQKLSSNYFNHFMLILRSRFGISCIESNQGYKAMIKAQKEDKLTITFIVGDQSPRNKSSKHWVKFLNQETAFLVGTDRIAKKLNYTVIFPIVHKYDRGKYELDFSLISIDPKDLESAEIINSYAKKLEETIIKTPELWLWSHRRWKLTKPEN